MRLAVSETGHQLRFWRRAIICRVPKTNSQCWIGNEGDTSIGVSRDARRQAVDAPWAWPSRPACLLTDTPESNY
jgi:hypothetical protein